MKAAKKITDARKDLVCAHCYIRFGSAERYLTKAGKVFHSICYEKARKRKV
jgi:hypothetical protein